MGRGGSGEGRIGTCWTCEPLEQESRSAVVWVEKPGVFGIVSLSVTGYRPHHGSAGHLVLAVSRHPNNGTFENLLLENIGEHHVDVCRRSLGRRRQ